MCTRRIEHSTCTYLLHQGNTYLSCVGTSTVGADVNIRLPWSHVSRLLTFTRSIYNLQFTIYNFDSVDASSHVPHGFALTPVPSSSAIKIQTLASHDHAFTWPRTSPGWAETHCTSAFLARFSEPGFLWCAVVSQLEKKSDVSHRISLVRATSRFCDETLHWFFDDLQGNSYLWAEGMVNWMVWPISYNLQRAVSRYLLNHVSWCVCSMAYGESLTESMASHWNELFSE